MCKSCVNAAFAFLEVIEPEIQMVREQNDYPDDMPSEMILALMLGIATGFRNKTTQLETLIHLAEPLNAGAAMAETLNNDPAGETTH